MKKSKWGTIYLVLVFVILYAPIFYLIFYSFNKGGTMHNFSGFTLGYYKEVFQDTRLLIIVLNTFVIAAAFFGDCNYYWRLRGAGD